MATRTGLLNVTFEGTPQVLAACSEVLEECLDNERELSGEFVAELQARVERLPWAPPQDHHRELVLIAATSIMALASLPEVEEASTP